MKTLDEIQNEVAKDIYNDTWGKLFDLNQLELWPEVCKRYATECCKATLEKASSSLIQYVKFTEKSNITLL